MAILDAKGLQEQLRQKKLSNLYYCYGSDTLAVENCVRRIVRAAGGSVTRLDGTQLDLDTLSDEVQMCPMLSEYNCIHIHDCNMEQLREGQRKALTALLEEVGSSTILIFDVTGFDIYGGKTGRSRKPTAKNKALIDRIGKTGTVTVCEPKNLSQLATEIIALARKHGCTMERPAAQALAQQCGCQSLVIRQEMGKLCAYADGGEITGQMVTDMVAPQLETTVYALTGAVLRYRAGEAMHAVDDLLAMQVEMPYLMATLAGTMIDLQRAAAARRAGKTVQDVAEDFSYRFDFIVDRAFRDSMGETPEHITHCLELLCRAEKQLHSGAVDERVLFEKTIVEMLRR